MRILSCHVAGKSCTAVRRGADLIAVDPETANLPTDINAILAGGREALQALDRAADRGRLVDPAAILFDPPVRRPGKVLCIGLNYADHVDESPYPKPTYPTLFPRYASSLTGHWRPILRPSCSVQLDYEGELVAIIGRRGRHVPRDRALDWIAGYSIMNEASIRDYQFKTPQWAVGKNFDATGAVGPELVTADELPAGGAGLRLETRLNGQIVQSADTANLLFGVGAIVSILSEVMTLEPGDLIATGTPEGVGLFRDPPLFMKDGDLVEVEIEGLGVLSNPVVDDVASLDASAHSAPVQPCAR